MVSKSLQFFFFFFFFLSLNGKAISTNYSYLSEFSRLLKNKLRNNYKDTLPKGWSDDQLKKLWCGDLATKEKVEGTATDTVEYIYEQRLWEMSGAKMGVDNEENAKKKIQLWWNKNKTKCNCSTVGFIPNGNILKFALAQSLPSFVEALVLNYELDINFIDPVDSRNVLDYINDEIERLKKGSFSKSSIEVYESYKESLIGLGAKPSK